MAIQSITCQYATETESNVVTNQRTECSDVVNVLPFSDSDVVNVVEPFLHTVRTFLSKLISLSPDFDMLSTPQRGDEPDQISQACQQETYL